jgi:hypothetical protein
VTIFRPLESITVTNDTEVNCSSFELFGRALPFSLSICWERRLLQMEPVLPRYLVGLFATSRRRKVPRSDKELTPDYEILFRLPRASVKESNTKLVLGMDELKVGQRDLISSLAGCLPSP